MTGLHKPNDKSWLRARALELLMQCLNNNTQHPLNEAVHLSFKEAGVIYYARQLLRQYYAQPWTMKTLSSCILL